MISATLGSRGREAALEAPAMSFRFYVTLRWVG